MAYSIYHLVVTPCDRGSPYTDKKMSGLLVNGRSMRDAEWLVTYVGVEISCLTFNSLVLVSNPLVATEGCMRFEHVTIEVTH